MRFTVAGPMRVSERAFQADVIGVARMLGYESRADAATNAPRRCPKCRELIHPPRNAKGFPDLILYRAGSRDRQPRFIIAELKAADTAVKPEQRTTLAALKAAGVETYLWRYGPRIMQEIADVLALDQRPAA